MINKDTLNPSRLAKSWEGLPINKLRHSAKKYLDSYGIEDSASVVSVILTDNLNISKTELIIGNLLPTYKQLEGIAVHICRAATHEPVQYIIEKCEFMSLMFYVKQGVLIPRADSEILAETAISCAKKLTGNNIDTSDKTITIWDLCCGSGCIGLSLAKYIQNCEVTLGDISLTAIDVTKTNIQRLGLASNTQVIEFDVLKDIMPISSDIVVSNPPYIEKSTIDSLSIGVKDFEPRLALDGGTDGLDFYRKIADTAKVKQGGYLVFEIGYNQGLSVSEIMKNAKYSDVTVIKDLENRDRVVIGKRLSE